MFLLSYFSLISELSVYIYIYISKVCQFEKLLAADGQLGWPDSAPYDAIHVGAAAREIPQSLIDQLKPGGRMVIPVGDLFQDLKVVDKNLDGSVSIRSEMSVRYVPLTSLEAQLS